ncbi:MAG: hypothetical protein QOG59_1094, partial [Solirubrobacteraceae bacterium]|nr:hypothetical protein [Solirubrobacteraceae bacterium]
MDWRRGRYAAVIALVGAIAVFALGAAPASAAPWTFRSSTTILPDASFTITPSPDYPSGQTLTFAANQTVDPNGGTLSYAWAVDGITTANTSSSFSQAFTGSHTITLTVTDSEGDPPQSTTQTIDQLP